MSRSSKVNEMKKLISLALLSVLALSGCSSTGSSAGNSRMNSIDDLIGGADGSRTEKVVKGGLGGAVAGALIGSLFKHKNGTGIGAIAGAVLFGGGAAILDSQLDSRDQAVVAEFQERGGALVEDVNGNVYMILPNQFTFATGSSQLSSDPLVNDVLTIIGKMSVDRYRGYTMSVIGHATPGWGNLPADKAEEKNRALSLQRANTVSVAIDDIFVSNNWPAVNMRTRGMGSASFVKTFVNANGEKVEYNLGSDTTVTIVLSK